MKVLIFMTQFYQLGGAERLSLELAEELNKRGIHTDILCQYTEDLPGVADAKQELLHRGIPKVHFLGMHVHPPITSMFPAITKLQHLIRENKYDIVETSMMAPTTLAAWATRGTTARHIAGLHQVFRQDRENSIQHRVWRLSVACNHRIRYYAISAYVARAWGHYSHTPAVKTRIIHNAIPESFFAAVPDRQGLRRELGIMEDTRIALYVGRLTKYKGIDTLLNALGPVLDSHNITLLYVGPIDPNQHGESQTIHHLLQQMKHQIELQGWGKRVRFLEYRRDVARLMASSDVLVHPTRMEGFGLVLAEALAAGLPVVSTNVEGIPEVLDGTDSLMVAPDNPAALRDAVLRTLNRSPLEASAAIEKGRKQSEAYRMDKRINLMVDMFRDVLESNQKRTKTKDI